MGFSNVQGIAGLPAVSREARILDGCAAAAVGRERVARHIASRGEAGERPPSLATIVVGSAPASEACLGAMDRACAETGVALAAHRFEPGVAEDAVAALIEALNGDATVDAILLQLPLPGDLPPRPLLERIDPAKDVDGLTLANATRLAQGMAAPVPATAKGILALLDHYGVELAGRRAVVVGRSELVGMPVAALLNQRDSTVTVCHSRSRELELECRRADVLIVAAGRRHLVGQAHVRRGATVVDVGVHRGRAGLVGDVDFQAVRRRAGAVSPVPGGVGPMMITALLENTLAAAAPRPNPVSPTQAARRPA